MSGPSALPLAALAALADPADLSLDWPAESWALLGATGVTAWSIPPEYGGAGRDIVELLSGYERLAGACLTTAFILSQREAAVRRLLASPAIGLRSRFLPTLARGEQYATVGLSQLTTSRQHQAPALVATPLGNAAEPDAFRLDGVIPWVTGADRAGLLAIGATLPDRRQVLLALPAGRTGVTVESPLRLAALSGSRTALVRCDGVRLERDLLLAGPVEKVVVGGGTVGGLETSTLALGLAGAAIDFLHAEAQQRPDLTAAAERFENVRRRARERLHRLAVHPGENADIIALRVSCTRLALQASQVALAVAKGTGFAVPHPARRWATQALFFLVWSCPRPAAEGMIAALLPDAD